MEVQFDQINSYLLQVFFQVSKGASVPDVVGDISGEEVKSLFFAELREAGTCVRLATARRRRVASPRLQTQACLM